LALARSGRIGDENPMSLQPPRFLYLQVNKRCNLRCTHCDFWMRDDDGASDYLGGARLAEVIEEFSEMNPRGATVLCGGEPMLSLDRYFEITALSRQQGLRSLSVVNGTRIRTPEMARRMIGEGPDEISISINSNNPEIHDRTRGIAGAFDKAVAAVRLLLEARREMGNSATRIYVMGLVFDESYRDLEAFYDFVLNNLGADKLKLNFLQPSFGHDKNGDAFFADHARLDADELVDIIKRCNARFKLGLNPIWLKQVGMYFRSLAAAQNLDEGWGSAARTSEHICNTYERNIMVDHYGFARLCFANGFRGIALERFGDLRRFWNTANDIRQEMASCNRLCGISHSVRRETSTLASRDATQIVDRGVLLRMREAIEQP
jgi:MoaA/NifB/PqqE/SkfB family radical SAM enzyme